MLRLSERQEEQWWKREQGAYIEAWKAARGMRKHGTHYYCVAKTSAPVSVCKAACHPRAGARLKLLTEGYSGGTASARQERACLRWKLGKHDTPCQGKTPRLLRGH